MSSHFESLPFEIQQFIVEYLDATYPVSLTALACTSKQLFAAVKPFLFRTIRFSNNDIRDYKGVRPDRISTAVQEYTKLLQRYNGIEHVQYLIVGENISFYDYHPHGPPPRPDHGPYHWRQSKIFYADRVALASADGEPCDESYPYGRVHSSTDHSGPGDCHNDNHAWKPLAEFIEMLSGLKHLLYHYSSQFPPCLLEALHSHRPGCKLHLYTFSMRSAPALDEYETKLLTSPCLHSIITRCECLLHPRWDTKIILEHPGELAMRHAVVVAPALKRVDIDIFSTRRMASRARKLPEVNMPVHKNTTSPLHSLRIFARRAPTLDIDALKRWTEYVDFSELKVLGISGQIDTEMLEYLESNYHFPSLRSLFLPFNLLKYSPKCEDGYYENSVEPFLCRLPPLLSLSMSYMTPGMNFGRIAEHHGTRLRRLEITKAALNEYRLKCLAKHCPNLEYLKLCLMRSLGDANEVALYHALGSIPRLVDVELELKAPDRHVRDMDHPDSSDGDSFDDFHEQDCVLQKDRVTEYIKNGHVRNMFMNCALDKDLASAVFQAISAGKTKDISRPMRKLNIRMTGGRVIGYWDDYNDNHITKLILRVCQWWQLERSPRDDRQNDLIITQLDAENHPERRERSSHDSTSNVEEVLRRLWPGIKDMSDWESHWHSFPLAKLDREAGN